jgi:hypothetical protein
VKSRRFLVGFCTLVVVGVSACGSGGDTKPTVASPSSVAPSSVAAASSDTPTSTSAAESGGYCKSGKHGSLELPASGPMLTDDTGCEVENPDLVRKVYSQLEAGDYDALMKYGGPDRSMWNEMKQPELLRRPDVRAKVMKSMTVHPHCDGGCTYPGFTVTGWNSDIARNDAKVLGVDPAAVPDPTARVPVYTSAFPACACNWSGVTAPS